MDDDRKIVAVGTKDLVTGLRLAGISESYLPEKIDDLITNQQAAVVLIAESTLAKLEPAIQKKMEKSVKPIFIEVADNLEKKAESSLRERIKRVMGIDLLKKSSK